MSTSPPLPPSKPVGFRTLHEITGYIGTDDGQIIKVTLVVMKLRRLEPPVPTGPMPEYNTGFKIVTEPLTTEEYKAMVKGDLNA